MPYHADGSRSRECAIVERQVATLQAAWPRSIPVLFWDESFSTRRVLGPRRPQAGSRRDREAQPSSETVHHIVKAEVSALNTKVDALKTEDIIALNTKVDALDAKVDSKVDALDSKVDVLNDRLTALEAKVETKLDAILSRLS